MSKDPPSKSASTMTFREDLQALIGSVQYDGDFCATQKVDATLRNLPAILIDGIGRLAYPIDTDIQLKQIRSIASEAPVGVGEDTVVDKGYRKTWQLEASQVKVTGGHQGDQWLRTIVSTAVQGLGIHNEKVEAKLHKLLLHEEGSFFKTHRDSQKEPGMFATLAIQLPSSFQGGSMKIEHLGATKRVPLEEDSDVCLRWTAWYADCYHENETLTGGHRIALIYNLVRTTAIGSEPRPPLAAWDYTKELEMLWGIVQKWQDSLGSKSPSDDTNQADSLEFFKSDQALYEYRKLNDLRYVHMLDHSYSALSFPAIGDVNRIFGFECCEPEKTMDRVVQVDSWEGLKGRDRNIAGLFCAFGGPLRVRFVVQDIINKEDAVFESGDCTDCQTTEIHKHRQPDHEDDQQQKNTTQGSISVALDMDNREVYDFGLYQSDDLASDAYDYFAKDANGDHSDDLDYRYCLNRVAQVESRDRAGNDGTPVAYQYRVGYLIVELQQQ